MANHSFGRKRKKMENRDHLPEHNQKKCKATNNLLDALCVGMSESLNAPYTKQKGLVIQELVNSKTLEPSADMIVLRSGDHNKKGMTINHCPFCGVEIFDCNLYLGRKKRANKA